MNATAYGFADTDSYIKNTRDNLCRFIQIEHIDAVNALNEIVQNPYIDGYIFGANDLSGSLGRLGDVFGNETTAAIQKSMDILRANRKYIGISTGDTSEKVLSYWHNMGLDMISAGADFDFLREGAKQTRAVLRNIHK